MESLKIKGKLFEIVREEGENRLIANFKNKQYEITKFSPKTQEGDMLIYSFKRIESLPMPTPKLKWIDKKLGYIVREHIETKNMMDILSKEDVSENILDQLFKAAYFARSAMVTVDYTPKGWGIKDGTLYYISDFFSYYDKNLELVDKYIRYWFNTRELADFLKNNGVFYDKNRLKPEYEVNKQIVLMACKYYR